MSMVATHPCWNTPPFFLCFLRKIIQPTHQAHPALFQRLLDFEKYLSGNELQIGGFDLLYKEPWRQWRPGVGDGLLEI